MSEFKFACPVCGQHMMCDASQGGTVMDCPTCFQKIVAPQAPAEGSKIILTGSKLVDKKIPVPIPDASVRVEKPFPAGAVLALVIFGLCAGAAAFIYFRPQKPSAPPPPEIAAVTNAPKPVVAAPPADDNNWSLTLGTNGITDTPVAGRIHGQDFLMERSAFANGTLTLRSGTRGPLDFGCSINFSGAAAESLAGKSLNIIADTNKAARVTLHWKDEAGKIQREHYDMNYAMRLEFGPLANNRLPGKIWLCTPDAEKSYLLGTFNADARKPKPKTPKK